MSMSTTFAGELLEQILNNAAIPLIGDASGLQPSAADGNLYAALHTADPTAAGTQDNNECAYTNYARVALTRDGTKWTVTNNVAENASAITFPQCTGGSETATHISIGVASSGSTKILFRRALNSNLAISNNHIPTFPAGDVTITGVTSIP
jgi:hypothetical protein